MEYRKCGKSGLLLPVVTLGLWHNFGSNDCKKTMSQMLHTAFDHGITSFDLANNYGPIPGAAEENFGRILKAEFVGHRDEILVTTKAGHLMWDGPYGDWASRKHIMASIDQSLKRLDLEYVDIFYSHRPDPNTPMEETMQALADIVRSGKALYIGLSKYSKEQFSQACEILRDLGRVPIVYQGRSSILRQDEMHSVIDAVDEQNCGYTAFSALAQGLLSGRYLDGIPKGSRADNSENPFLQSSDITPDRIDILRKLNEIALERGETLAQMAVAWLLNDKRVTSVIIGASRPDQILDTIGSVGNSTFNLEELQQIEQLRLQF